jgi:hypothetical protein
MAEWPWKTQGATVNDMNESAASPSREMPRYKCHKEVWALKIKSIEQAPADQERANAGGDWYIVPEEEGYARFLVGHDDYIKKHMPEAGGYYVVYDDGYKSYSPAKAFEEGYTRKESGALELGAAVRAAGLEGSYES